MRKRTTGAPSLASFTIPERLCFSAGWAPHQPWEAPGVNVWRWVGWPEFLRDWAAIRHEYIALHGEHRPNGLPLFADVAAEYARRHGLAALAAADSYEIRGQPSPKAGETFAAYQRRVAGDDNDPDSTA